jgi:WD40 repeat protein
MVYRWLVDDEHEVFLDRHPHTGIAPGDEWDKRLHERLRWADAVVCVLTSAFTRSTWCAAEVALARSRGALVVPVLTEAGVRHPLLTDLQAIDATRDPQNARRRLTGRLVSLYGAPSAVPDDLEPFPGLLPFDADRHRLFFGREADVQRLTEALRSPAERAAGALFVLVGPSGCGKSSLVRAGLLPTVARDPDQFSLAPIVPGRDPAGSVCVELAEAGTRRLRLPGWGIEEVRRRVEAHGLSRVLDELLLVVPGPRRTRVILVVDQFEELLTRSSAEARAEFAELVGPALTESLQVIATLRPEFLDPLLAAPELAGLPKRIHTLEPLSRAGLRSVIEKPAEIAGIELDDGLADQLVTDTGSGEALPLLAYTLAQLAEGVKRGGRLTLARYDQLGGVQGTLTAQADDALAEAVRNGGRDRAAVIRSLMRMVHVDEQGRPARIRVPLAELPPEVVAELDPFLEHRLLSTATEIAGGSDADPQDDGRVVVGVAHEAFLSAWAPLRDAIRRDPVAFRAQRRLEQAATRWAASGHHRRHLWSGSQLTGAAADLGARLRRGTLHTDRAELDDEAAGFLRASMLRSRRLRQGLVTGLAVLALVMTVIGGIALWQRDLADEQRRIAIARQLLTQADAARDSDVREALMLGVAAYRLDPGPEAEANLLDTLTSTAYSRTVAGDVPVVTIAVSPDGLTLAEGGIDGRATLWDVSDPLLPRRLGSSLTAQRGYVYDLEFSPDGRLLAAAGADRTVALWEVADPAAPRPLGVAPPEHRDDVHAIAFSPDGQVLASVDFAGRLVVRDITDPAAPTVLSDVPTGHRGEVVDVTFAPDRPLLATAGLDHTVRLWDVTDLAHPAAVGAPLVGQDHPVWAVAFAPGGRVLTSTDADGYLTQWDVTEGATLLGTPVRAHTGAAYALAYSRDGTRIATVGADRAVRQWSVTDPAAPRPVGDRLTGHTDQVYSVAYGRDDATLATGSADCTTVLWDLNGPNRPMPVGAPVVRGPSPSVATAISSDRRWLATGGQGRAIAMWDVSDPAQPHPRPDPLDPPGEVRALAFSPTAPVLAATTADGALAMWDTTGSGPPRPLGAATVATGPASALAFAPDGRRIAVAGQDRSVSLWDVTDPTRPARIGDVATEHTGPVNTIAFAPDGRRLASGAADGSVMLWDVSGSSGPRWIRPTLVGGGAPKFSVAFSPNGRRLAAGGTDGSTLLFEISAEGGRPDRDGTPLPADGGPVYAITFSPDSSLLVGGGRTGSISIWDVSEVRTARPLGQPVPAAIGSINSLAFAPGATWLAASGGGGSTAIWDLAGFRELRAQAVERACATTGRGMTPQEWASLIDGVDYQDTCAPD